MNIKVLNIYKNIQPFGRFLLKEISKETISKKGFLSTKKENILKFHLDEVEEPLEIKIIEKTKLFQKKKVQSTVFNNFKFFEVEKNEAPFIILELLNNETITDEKVDVYLNAEMLEILNSMLSEISSKLSRVSFSNIKEKRNTQNFKIE